MCTIYPFKAIVPTPQFVRECNIENNFVHLKQDIVPNALKYDYGIKYILRMMQRNYLVQQSKQALYCCNITAPGIATKGLLALIKVSNLGKIIFEHERCDENKKRRYIQYFKNHKLQTSPIILIHKNIEQINVILDKVISEQENLLSIRNQEYQYDLWQLENILEYQALYNKVSEFLIADGHHRMASLNEIDTNAHVLVFLVSERNIKSANILREYFNTNDAIKSRLLTELSIRFRLKKINRTRTINLSNKICIKIDANLYSIEESDTALSKLQILELFNNEINYFNKELNFRNTHLDSNQDILMNNARDIVVFIPACALKDNIERITYPPHSTLFYPKIPEGLVSFLLHDFNANDLIAPTTK